MPAAGAGHAHTSSFKEYRTMIAILARQPRVARLASAAGLALALLAAPPDDAAAAFLVGNTQGNNVSMFDETSGAYIGDFIAAGSGGLVSPDDLTYGPDGNLYVSSSSGTTTGQILRYDGRTGAFIDVFAQGGGMARPYGVAFGPDGLLYVASFRSDQILRYDGTSGAFVDVFAAGNGTAGGLLNGPNDLHFGADGSLYVTTQGSVADGAGGISYKFDSEVLRYDIATGAGSVVASGLTAFPSGGFVSLLGVAFGPDGRLYTSDFAGGIRSFDAASGALLQSIELDGLFGAGTGSIVGNFAFGGDGALYASVFKNFDTTVTGIARCVVDTGECSLFADGSDILLRPIGFAVTPVPEPAAALLMVLGLAALWGRQRLRRLARHAEHTATSIH
jgi:sugar lactone lactonase YvrE